VLLLFAGTLLLFSCQRASGEWHGDQKLVILGIDGMDPQLLTRFMQEGKMPNFARLAQQGVVPVAHDQHPTPESGGLVKPDHRYRATSRNAKHREDTIGLRRNYVLSSRFPQTEPGTTEQF
jgi:hypothetical protein